MMCRYLDVDIYMMCRYIECAHCNRCTPTEWGRAPGFPGNWTGNPQSAIAWGKLSDAQPYIITTWWLQFTHFYPNSNFNYLHIFHFYLNSNPTINLHLHHGRIYHHHREQWARNRVALGRQNHKKQSEQVSEAGGPPLWHFSMSIV